jgi:hypothetical protein
MRPMVDPSKGDIEDDASSTKQRSLFSLAGTLLAEISFSKLAVAWILLVGLPGLRIGAAPLLASIWIASVLSKASALLSGLWPALLLLALVVIGWFGGRPLLRLAESSFWSLNALAVQPGYVLCREGFRHIAERLLPSDMTDDQRAITRAASAAVSGLVICGLALWLVALAWPSSRWVGNLSDLRRRGSRPGSAEGRRAHRSVRLSALDQTARSVRPAASRQSSFVGSSSEQVRDPSARLVLLANGLSAIRRPVIYCPKASRAFGSSLKTRVMVFARRKTYGRRARSMSMVRTCWMPALLTSKSTRHPRNAV